MNRPGVEDKRVTIRFTATISLGLGRSRHRRGGEEDEGECRSSSDLYGSIVRACTLFRSHGVLRPNWSHTWSYKPNSKIWSLPSGGILGIHVDIWIRIFNSEGIVMYAALSTRSSDNGPMDRRRKRKKQEALGQWSAPLHSKFNWIQFLRAADKKSIKGYIKIHSPDVSLRGWLSLQNTRLIARSNVQRHPQIVVFL